ncbi:MAG: hypothetical protein K6E22_14825 [Treponema sp.]|nr:hypothetical protein [Treponema sp.]
MSEEVDIIEHLLDVERESSQMILDARLEADKIIAESRARAENSFKEQYNSILKGLEAEEASSKEEISRRHEEQFSEYKQSLAAAEKDEKAFRSLLDTLLFS